MKKTLNNLQEALTFMIKGLYNAETELQKALTECLLKASNINLRTEIKNYAESSSDKLLKLERVLTYLAEEPKDKINPVMEKLLDETHYLLKHASNDKIRDVLIISCIQNINHYKIAGYGTAQSLAMELELATVTDLLHEILTWEKQTDRHLTKIATDEVNVKAAKAGEVF